MTPLIKSLVGAVMLAAIFAYWTLAVALGGKDSARDFLEGEQ